MHGCAIVTETPPSMTAMECTKGGEKEDRKEAEPERVIFELQSQSGKQTLA